MSKRVEFPKKVKLAAWHRAGGRCEKCSAFLVGRFAYDHRNPSEFSGDASLENCQCLCLGCHAVKTARDVTAIAKSNRIRATAAGIRRPGKFLTNRDGPFKRKMDGTTEKRR